MVCASGGVAEDCWQPVVKDKREGLYETVNCSYSPSLLCHLNYAYFFEEASSDGTEVGTSGGRFLMSNGVGLGLGVACGFAVFVGLDVG